MGMGKSCQREPGRWTIGYDAGIRSRRAFNRQSLRSPSAVKMALRLGGSCIEWWWKETVHPPCIAILVKRIYCCCQSKVQDTCLSSCTRQGAANLNILDGTRQSINASNPWLPFTVYILNCLMMTSATDLKMVALPVNDAAPHWFAHTSTSMHHLHTVPRYLRGSCGPNSKQVGDTMAILKQLFLTSIPIVSQNLSVKREF